MTWTGDDTIRANMREYERKAIFAVTQVAIYWSAVIEADAKRNAVWTDQTGNARQSLAGYTNGNSPGQYAGEDSIPYPDVTTLANDTVMLFLSHGVDYGVQLETKYAGKYSIVWATISRRLPEINTMLKQIFS